MLSGFIGHFLHWWSENSGAASRTCMLRVSAGCEELLLHRMLGPLSGFVGLRLQLAVLTKENFDLAFRFLQLLAAGGGTLQPFFEKLQCLLERHIAFLQLIDNLFQALKTIFKIGH